MKKFYKLVECDESEIKARPHVVFDPNNKHPHLGRLDVNFAILRDTGSVYVVDLKLVFPEENH